MPSNKNNIIIAAAGSGKTTHIVEKSLETDEKVAIVTYTRNNAREIEKKIYQLNKTIPRRVTVITWFRFLLSDWIRPYGNFTFNHRVEGVNFVNGRSAPYVKKCDIRYFLSLKDYCVYTDKIAEFALKCNEKSKGLVMCRLSDLYRRIYIDEVQDLAGYDLEALQVLLDSDIHLTLVGDYRQATYQTNQSSKNRKYKGVNIVKKFEEWEKNGKCKIQKQVQSFRCNQTICDFADSIYSDTPKTSSKNCEMTGHDGLFVISSNDVKSYVDKYSPQILRYDKRTKCTGYSALNFGDSKGMTFDRILIFPHNPLKKLLKTGNFKEIEKSVAKVYVAVTRAKYSVAFVYNGECAVKDITRWQI